MPPDEDGEWPDDGEPTFTPFTSNVPDGYVTKVWAINGVAEPDSFYWRVFFEGQVVNGGLTDDPWLAHQRVRHYRWLDIIERFKWDKRNRRWVKK